LSKCVTAGVSELSEYIGKQKTDIESIHLKSEDKTMFICEKNAPFHKVLSGDAWNIQDELLFDIDDSVPENSLREIGLSPVRVQ
jgi:hypothetical protein